jgi:hypothetical protein
MVIDPVLVVSYRIFAVLLGSYRILSDLMGSYRISVDLYGSLRIFTDIYGSLRILAGRRQAISFSLRRPDRQKTRVRTRASDNR